MMDKPASVVYEDLKRELAGRINASGLPFFVLEALVKDLYLELKTLSKKELEADRDRYAREQEEA